MINLTLAFYQKLSCTKLRTKHRWNASCKITLQLAFLKFCNMTSFETSGLLFTKYVPIRNSSYTQLMKTVIMQRTWHAHTFHCIHSDSHILVVSSWVVKTSVGESGVIWRLFSNSCYSKPQSNFITLSKVICVKFIGDWCVSNLWWQNNSF